MNKDKLRDLIKEAQHSCFIFYKMMSEDETEDVNKAVVMPMMKWIDVVNGMINDDENLVVNDLEMIIIEPMKLLTDACASRLSVLGKPVPTIKSMEAYDVFERKKAYVEHINELFHSLETVTNVKFPRIKETNHV